MQNDSPLITPQTSRLGYVFAAAFLVLAIAWFVVALVNGLGDATKGLHRMVVPGSATITIDRPGKQKIYHEYRSMVGGVRYTGERAIRYRVQVTDPSGEPRRVNDLGRASEKYSLGNRSGYSLASFDAPRKGDYEIDVEADHATVLAIGTMGIWSLLGRVMGGTLLLGALSAACFGVTLRRRIMQRRAAAGHA